MGFFTGTRPSPARRVRPARRRLGSSAGQSGRLKPFFFFAACMKEVPGRPAGGISGSVITLAELQEKPRVRPDRSEPSDGQRKKGAGGGGGGECLSRCQRVVRAAVRRPGRHLLLGASKPSFVLPEVLTDCVFRPSAADLCRPLMCSIPGSGTICRNESIHKN